jgi:hypothetical protein
MPKTVNIEDIRKAIANYMLSEGCSCCQDISAHEHSAEIIAKMLNVPLYSDGSGYNFTMFSDRAKDFEHIK